MNRLITFAKATEKLRIMKTLRNSILGLLVGAATVVSAQTQPPKPPAPPSTSTSSTTSSSTSSTTISNGGNISVITQNGDYGQGGNTSVSISSKDDEYRIKAHYPENRYPALKKYLVQEMGSNNLQTSGKVHVWSLEGDADTAYELELDEDRLKLEVNKEVASPDLIAKFEKMGPVIRNLISGGDKRSEISRLERDAERARRNADRMQREADRLRQMNERRASIEERTENRGRAEADRLLVEADRLRAEADRKAEASKRQGGIDGYVRNILSQPSTRYVLNTTGNDGWKWPAFQNALISDLEKSELISPSEEIVFVREEDNGVFVNGQKLSPSMWDKMDRLIKKYDFGNVGDLSFYRMEDHIAVITSNVDLEGLLEDLEDKGFITDADGESTIYINGASVEIDGKKLSPSETSRWNAFLHKNNIIPAPGKSIILGKDFASMGYSFDKSTIGTWYSRG